MTTYSFKARTSQQAYKARVRARHNRLPATLTTTEWRATLRRFGGACAYCARTPRIPDLDLFLPAHLGGGATKNNCLPACRKCRYKKGKHNPFAEGKFWGLFSDGALARKRVTAFMHSVGGAQAPMRVMGPLKHYQNGFAALCDSDGGILVGSRKVVSCPACLELMR